MGKLEHVLLSTPVASAAKRDLAVDEDQRQVSKKRRICTMISEGMATSDRDMSVEGLTVEQIQLINGKKATFILLSIPPAPCQPKRDALNTIDDQRASCDLYSSQSMTDRICEILPCSSQ